MVNEFILWVIVWEDGLFRFKFYFYIVYKCWWWCRFMHFFSSFLFFFIQIVVRVLGVSWRYNGFIVPWWWHGGNYMFVQHFQSLCFIFINRMKKLCRSQSLWYFIFCFNYYATCNFKVRMISDCIASRAHTNTHTHPQSNVILEVYHRN